MSLLLQALQKAAKSRETFQASSETTVDITSVSGPTLELEPGDIEPGGIPARAGDEPAARGAGASPAPAAGDLPNEPPGFPAAGGTRAPEDEPRFNLFDYARERPVPVFAAFAALFLLGYGAYVYIAVSNPALLTRGLGGGTPAKPPPLVAKPPSPVAPAARQTGAPGPDLLEPPPPGSPPAPAQPPAAPAVQAPPSAQLPAAPVALPPGPGNPAALNPPPPAAASPTLPLPAGSPATGTSGSTATDARALRPAVSPSPQTRPRVAVSRPARSPRPEPGALTARAVETGSPGATSSAGQPEQPVTVRPSDLPGSISARLAEAWDHAQKGRLAEAEAGYESVLAQDPRNTDAMTGLASIAWQQGRTERAADLYGRILELDPQNPSAQAGLIGLLGRANPQVSESRLRNLIAREPSGQLYFTLGNLYAAQSQWAQAQQAYFQAFQSEPGNPDYAFNLAVGLDRLGQRKPALEYYRKAVDLSFARGRAGFDQKAAISRIAQLASSVE